MRCTMVPRQPSTIPTPDAGSARAVGPAAVTSIVSPVDVFEELADEADRLGELIAPDLVAGEHVAVVVDDGR